MKILLVGEKINNKVSNIPFDKRYNSGKYLHQALLCLPYYRYGNLLINFENVIKKNKINRELKHKQYFYDEIIALGNVADKILTKLEIEHKSIVHPAFHKRFKSKKGIRGYSKLLENAIWKLN